MMMRLTQIANRGIPRFSVAAALMASFVEVKYWLGLDPESLWGAAPLPNPPVSLEALRPRRHW